jgi:hypothetical protein
MALAWLVTDNVSEGATFATRAEMESMVVFGDANSGNKV